MIGEFFLESAIKRFEEYKALGEKTFSQLNDEQFNWQPNEASNSITVIVKHLHGNMLSRWTNFLTEDGEKEWRKRDEEFEIDNLSKADVLKLWDEGWTLLLQTLKTLTKDD